MKSNDIVLGDVNVPGITDTDQNGVVRLNGANEDLFSQAINNYNSPKTVYGRQVDTDLAQGILGTTGYNYVATDSNDFTKPAAFTSNDIILGDAKVSGIPDSELSEAIIRLGGIDSVEISNLVRNYSTAKNVFGASIDIQNAKRYLGTAEYNYIEIDQPGFIKPSSFSSNDIIIGSPALTNISEDEAEHKGAKRYFGTDRHDTVRIIRELAGIKLVIGAATDSNNAKSILGTTIGYEYQNLTEQPEIPSTFTSNMIVLGGTAATGITDPQLNGAIRLWGDNAELTAQAINNYNSPRYVYGVQVDIENAKKILGSAGHTYITLTSTVDSNTSFTYNDIILGDTVTGITDNQLRGAIRLGGAGRTETAAAIENYRKSKNIYGVPTDINNAKGILGTTGYNYIDTSFSNATSPTLPIFTCNDIILGEIATHVNRNSIYGAKGAIGLTGDNRDLTAQAIMDYAHVPDLANGSWGNINTSNMLVPITIDGINGETTTIPINTKVQIYSSDGDYYDCYYSGTSGIKILKMYLTGTTAPTTPGTGGSTIDNIKNNTSLGLSQSIKDSMISVATTLLNQGYKAAFVAGVLGNIMNEGNFGYFESSAYTSNPENEPSYLKYMDDHYNYRQLFSGKSISQVGVAATYDLVQKIIKDKVTNTASFGLGAIQWTWDRMVSLVNCYVQVCGQNSYPTEAQCIQVENQMVSNELNGSYNSVYTNWLSQYSDNANGAYGAGSVVCNQYESPDPNAGGVNQAEDRGKNAQNVYNVMMGL